MEEKNQPVVIVARRARLGVHVGHIERHVVPQERALAVGVLARLFAAQLARFRVRIGGAGDALARLQAVRQTDRSRTFAHVAHELLVADGFVRFVDRRRTLRLEAVAEARIAAAVVVATLVAQSQHARVRAAGTLRRAAAGRRRQRARLLVGLRVAGHREAAGVDAVVLPAAVALFAGFDHTVATDGSLRFCAHTTKTLLYIFCNKRKV